MSAEPIKYSGTTPLLTVLRDSRYIGQEAMRHSAADEIGLLRSMLGECADALYGVDGLGTYDALVKRARAHLADADDQQSMTEPK